MIVHPRGPLITWLLRGKESLGYCSGNQDDCDGSLDVGPEEIPGECPDTGDVWLCADEAKDSDDDEEDTET